MSKITIEQAVELTKGKLINCSDSQKYITTAHSLSNTDYIPESFAFFKDVKFTEAANSACVDLIITSEKYSQSITNSAVAQLIVDDPYLAFAQVSLAVENSTKPAPGIHPTAVIAKTAVLGENVSIGPFVVIGENVIIGDNSVIEAHSSVAANCKIGAGVWLHPHVVLYHAVELADFVVVHSLTVLGADGFGYAFDRTKLQYVRIPQVGTTKIGARTEIGALTSIDRGAIKDTIVENDVIIDNHIHLAHNTKVGMGTAMAGGTIVAGSTEFGRFCQIGGASVFAGHIKIADQISTSGMLMCPQSLSEPGKVYSSGLTVEENRKWLRTNAMLKYDRLKAQQDTIKAQGEEIQSQAEVIKELQNQIAEIKALLNK